jgi:hypothetical protein
LDFEEVEMTIARDINATLLAALDDPLVKPIIMCRLELDSGIVAWHSGFGSLVYNAVTYTGTGVLGEVSALRESSDLSPTSMTMTVSGLDPSILSLVLSEVMTNRPAYILLTALDDAGEMIGGAPMELFRGRLTGGIPIELGTTASVKITVASRLADWERKIDKRYNDATQQAEYPGDLFFQYIDELAGTKEIVWPGSNF